MSNYEKKRTTILLISGIPLLFLLIFKITQTAIDISGLLPQTADILQATCENFVTSLFLVVFILYYFELNLKNKNTRNKFIVFSVIVSAFFLLYEPIMSNFYTFQKPIEVCEYTLKCNLNGLHSYENKEIAVFINDKELFYYKSKENGWKITNNTYKKISEFKGNGVVIEIYSIEDFYFIYLKTIGENNIESISDNTNINFKQMKIPYHEYDNSDSYGKIVKTIENYKIFINEKEINI